MKVLTREELKLQDAVEQIKKKGIDEIEIYLHRELCCSDEFMNRRDWFTEAILNLTGEVTHVQIRVWDEEAIQIMEDAVERVKDMWMRNMGHYAY